MIFSTLLLLIGLFSGSNAANSNFLNSDSLRLETANGKSFVIHQVDKGETLFSISRKYAVAVSLILENNPGSDSGIEAGQLLKVPYASKPRVRTKDGIVHTVGEKQTLYSIAKQYGVTVDQIKLWNNLGEKSLQLGMKILIKDPSELPTSPKEDIASKSQSELIHVVADKETLFAISKKYQVTVNELIQWNALSSSSVKAGQKLVIKNSSPSVVATPAKESKLSEQSVKEQKPIVAEATEKIEPVKADEKNETGYALISDRGGDSRKYLGYHRTIPEGTVLRVRNKDNRKEIFVRIAGRLSETEDKDVLIRISKAAWDKIGGSDRFPVEIIFFD